MKHCYRKRINQKKSTRWQKLGDPTLYIDVTIVRAKFLSKKFCEEYAMGLVERGNYSYVSVGEFLEDGYGKVNLIEGDPGVGKTTFTFKICQEWAENKILIQDIVLWIPLRHYKSVTTTSELFDELGYPELMEYARHINGKGLVLILDGWDELPNNLQAASLFHDIIFSTIRTFTQSTIIVTSRPSCSSEIAGAVEETNSYYQILGFGQEKAVSYIKAYNYFHNDSTSAELLLAFLNSNVYLYQHFYIPISVAIMCFVYSSDGNQIPQSLSRLYERFVLLWLRSNVPSKYLSKFKTIHNIPDMMKPAFHNLCKIACNMLKNNKLVIHEEELEVIQDGLDNVQLNDGFGLLHVDHYTGSLATTETCYSFIHRSVQELLAAIFMLDTCNLSDILDKYFYSGSYLMNVFPFLFGLASKELLRPLARVLIQIFNGPYNSCNQLLPSILYCLFEAHDVSFCREFGEVFSKKKCIKLDLRTLLDYHYVCYFIVACGIKRLNVTMTDTISFESCNLSTSVICKYLQSPSTDIASLHFYAPQNSLSHKEMEQLAKSLSTQHNILSVHLFVKCAPGCVTILCNSICKYNLQITNLTLISCGSDLNESDFKSVGSILTTLSINVLQMDYSPCEENCLDLSLSLYKALCETKSLQKLLCCLSQTDSIEFSKILRQNCSLKELWLNVDSPDCLCPILNGLSSNISISTFRVYVNETAASNTLGQCLEECLTLNHSLSKVDFVLVYNLSSQYVTWSRSSFKYISWTSTQVSSICAGLCVNTTVVVLDISGCYIDTEACHAVCGMMSQNKTMRHFFLNPAHLEEEEAVAMINSCEVNVTLELLSLVQWPSNMCGPGKHPFIYSYNSAICHLILKIQKLRRQRNRPLLNVHWLVAVGIVLMCYN